MIGDNAAPRPCGVTRAASYFFESEDSATGAGSVVLIVAPRALALRLLQSFTICPGPPQNMQSLLSKHRCRSSLVNFPSFPSFPCNSGLRDAGVALGRVVLGLGPARSELSGFLSEGFWFEFEGLFWECCWGCRSEAGFDDSEVFGDSREILERRSQ